MFCYLSDMGFIKIQGNDAKKFLQGQLTCDVEMVTAEHSSMGAHCNREGRVISLFYLFLLGCIIFSYGNDSHCDNSLKIRCFSYRNNRCQHNWHAIGVQPINLAAMNLQIWLVFPPNSAILLRVKSVPWKMFSSI